MSVKGRASFLSLMLLITLLSGCTGSEDENINSEKTGPDYDGGGLNDGVDYYDDGEISVEFYFDIERTSRNPLRGFYTNYDWGEPVIDFPSSLEFAYIPLSELMNGPSNFTFETGLEPRLIAAEERTHQLVLRPYIDYPNVDSGLPSFLIDKVEMKSYSEHGGGLSPDYDDPDLQASLFSFIEALGREYDGDSRIAVIQLGLLGFWGEWHTWPHPEFFPGLEFQSEILNAYVDSFNHTLLQVRYPIADSPSLRLGFHDDSFAYSTIGDVDWYFHPSLVHNKANESWRENPIGGELRPELQRDIFDENMSDALEMQDFNLCVETTHASMLLYYQAFSGGINTTAERENAEAAALSLGYTLHISNATLTGGNLEVFIENRGVAPFYPDLKLQVQDGNGTISSVVLSRITADQGPQRYFIDTSILNSPSIEIPWIISLQSDYILATQEILFATKSGNGPIQVK